MWARGCLALGEVLLSNSSTVCADNGFTSTTDTHLYLYALVFRESVLLKIISALILGLWPIALLHVWACKIQGENCPSASHSDKSRSDVLQSRRRLRPWIWLIMVCARSPLRNHLAGLLLPHYSPCGHLR